MIAPSENLAGSEAKLCKDCIYFRAYPSEDDSRYALAKCGRTGAPDLVSGGLNMIYCVNERQDQQGCGVSGRFFQAKV